MENSNQRQLFNIPIQNRELIADAARSLNKARPDMTHAQLAAVLGVSRQTVGRMLKENDEQQAQPDTQPAVETGEASAAAMPSRDYASAPSTASTIRERDAMAKLERAAYQIECGARRMQEAARELDALLKAAYVKGTQVGQELGCMLEVK